MSDTRSYLSFLRLLPVFVLIVLVACSMPSTASTPTPALTLTPTQTSLPEATATPTPLPGKALLVAPQGSNPQTVQEISKLVSGEASTHALTVETRQGLKPAEIGKEVKLVVFLAPPANLKELLAAAPQAQFVVLSPVDLEPAANLSVVRQQLDQQAFTAGYLAEVIAVDWRAGALLPADPAPGAQPSQAFVNGGNYLCGICNSVTGPVMRFPITKSLPAGSDAAAWQAAVEEMMKNNIYVLYVPKEASTPEMWSYLAGKNLILIGEQTPPKELFPHWAASVRLDALTPLKDLLPKVLAGHGGQVVNAPVQIMDVQAANFSQGRQGAVLRMLPDLENGLIAPLTPPLQ